MAPPPPPPPPPMATGTAVDSLNDALCVRVVVPPAAEPAIPAKLPPLSDRCDATAEDSATVGGDGPAASPLLPRPPTGEGVVLPNAALIAED